MKTDAEPQMAIRQAAADQARHSASLSQRKQDEGVQNSPLILQQKALISGIRGSTVQRAGEEEEKPLQGRFGSSDSAVQRMGEEEEKPLQGRFNGSESAVQRKEMGMSNRTGLPDSLKSGVENLSGLSLDSVKVHYNSDKPAQLNALAYTQGTDIHVAPGQERHLPHEAWHVVQQAQGRVQPTMQMKEGVPVNDDAGLENEADVMGSKASQ